MGGRLVGASGVALGLLTFAMLCPSPIEGAHAEEATIKTNVTVQPVLGLTMASNNYIVDITPTETGSFSSHTAAVSVTTNNETGYSLYLATKNGQSTLTNAEGTAEIASVSGTVAATNFTANTWGYNLSKDSISSSTTYQAVPTQNDDPAGGSETPVDGDNDNLTFGAFINTDLPGGAYTNQVIVSAVVNPACIPSLSQIDYMQEMTPEICQASSENETKQLTDTRDGKKYWVAKLADNNCWMTQNLRLSGGRTLTPTNSNVSSSWGFPNDSLKAGDTNYIGSSYNEAGSVINESASGGGYYNYCVASAGTVCNNTEQQDTTQDICPKGWKLPTLDEARGITAYSVAFLPVLNGYYYDGAPYNAGSAGYWWSATANDGKRQYGLYYNDSNNSLSTGSSGKNYGLSVRCISRQD